LKHYNLSNQQTQSTYAQHLQQIQQQSTNDLQLCMQRISQLEESLFTCMKTFQLQLKRQKEFHHSQLQQPHRNKNKENI
jgi:hypothetical protein